jgi:hypothetical protein
MEKRYLKLIKSYQIKNDPILCTWENLPTFLFDNELETFEVHLTTPAQRTNCISWKKRSKAWLQRDKRLLPRPRPNTACRAKGRVIRFISTTLNPRKSGYPLAPGKCVFLKVLRHYLSFLIENKALRLTILNYDKFRFHSPFWNMEKAPESAEKSSI